MQLRWTEDAANDLERIADYLLLNAPDRAHHLIQRLYDAPSDLGMKERAACWLTASTFASSN
jgi:plasmid stabilization system protein ParE